MGFIQHVADYFKSAPVDPAATDPRNQISSPLLASKRFILVLAFVALLYVAHEVFTVETLKILRDVVITYIICETVTKLATLVLNGVTKWHEVKADAAVPGTISASGGLTITTTAPAVVTTP